MKKIVLATGNQGKAAELKDLLANIELPEIRVLTLADFPDLPEVEETGLTFADNALLKARAAAQSTGYLALADDSGLEVDALNGAPGVYSARFAGAQRDDDANIAKLLNLLETTPASRRGARFQCALAIVDLNQEYVVHGTVEGRILTAKRGTMGFGYDPVFYLPELGKTMAEIEPQLKNSLSHRARAFDQAIPILARLLELKC